MLSVILTILKLIGITILILLGLILLILLLVLFIPIRYKIKIEHGDAFCFEWTCKLATSYFACGS